ncbi:MAG: 7-cyano-7-deazaguanine synthase QueC [Gemmatimonadales bacterium]|nr:7-cyano-7-deazaguanine synthase QueC [Gemmatimonadales bacterium]
MPKAVVLLSGGMDSATVAAIARDEGFALHALSFRYGQRHALELEAAARVARSLGAVRHLVVDADMRAIGGSALTADLAVPLDRSVQAIGRDIPLTYVPARNTIFLSFALGWAEVLGAHDIFIGAHAIDYSGYPDCRPEFLAAFERLAAVATKAGIEGQPLSIRAPLLALGKADIVRRGIELGVDFSLTVSCYDPSPAGEACGRCDACSLRLCGFAEAGMQDPARYQA